MHSTVITQKLATCEMLVRCFTSHLQYDSVFEPRQNYTKTLNPLNYCLQHTPEK